MRGLPRVLSFDGDELHADKLAARLAAQPQARERREVRHGVALPFVLVALQRGERRGSGVDADGREARQPARRLRARDAPAPRAKERAAARERVVAWLTALHGEASHDDDARGA